jgi:hypothetical protein
VLNKVINDGWIELRDARSGTVVARSPVDRTKVTSTLDNYERAVQARAAQLAKQQSLDSQLLSGFWTTPMSY